MPQKLSEHDVQRLILDWLAAKHIVHYRQNTGAAKLKGFYVKFGRRGAPDIVAVKDGRFIGIEVKKVGEEQSKVQFQFAVELTQAGGLYLVAYFLEDVTRVLG